MENKITYLNPDSLLKSPAFSQAVVTHGKGKTIYIGGQDAVNENNEIVGENDIQLQTTYVMKNIQTILAAGGAGWEHVVKLTIFLKQGEDAVKAFEAAQKIMGKTAKPPAVTVVFVAGFGKPGFLLEADAVAFVGED